MSIFVVMISRGDAIRKVDAGEEFSLKVVALDRRRKTGGNMVYYPKVKKLLQVAGSEPAQFTTAKNGKKKHPKHSENATRNLIDQTNGRTVKIHIHLMVLFNGEEVRW